MITHKNTIIQILKIISFFYKYIKKNTLQTIYYLDYILLITLFCLNVSRETISKKYGV